MKKTFILLFLAAITLSSCSNDGPQGPQGPQGPAGADGLIGSTFERTVDFEYLQDVGLYSVLVGIPDSIEVLPSDAVLVYRLEIAQDSNGNDIDTWSMLPQNFFLNEGTIQYVFNHSDVDVELLIDGNFDLSNLDSGYTQGQTFRFVVIPSDAIQSSNIDFTDMGAVMNALKDYKTK